MIVPFLLATICLTPVQDARAAFGLGPNVTVVAEKGVAAFANGDSIQLIAASNLAKPDLGLWSLNGEAVSGPSVSQFWDALDLSIDGKEIYSKDKEGRTFALVFKLSNGVNRALDVRSDREKTYRPLMSQSRTQDKVYESRIIGPMKDEPTMDFRLEIPGGDWTTLLSFPLTGETIDKGIEVIKRWQNRAEYVTINGSEEIVRMRVHYFTVTLPEALRDADLEIVSNDPAEDALRLGKYLPEHIVGEDQGKEFEGKNLFIVPCLNKLNFDRVFTLRARPKRIAEFRSIPFKR